MKAILIILASVTIFTYGQSPDPIPVPEFNLQKAQGLWYASLYYDIGINNETPGPWTCWSYNFELNEETVVANETTIIDGMVYGVINHFYPRANESSVWGYINTETFDWIALDPLNYQWGLFVSGQYQVGFLLSRAPTAPSSIVSLALKTLKSENYNVNATNYYILNNECPSSHRDKIHKQGSAHELYFIDE